MLMDLERRRKLGENAAKMASLDSSWCAACVAVLP